MQKKVLLATGHEDLNRILRNNFRTHEKKNFFHILEHDVLHQRYLLEVVEETLPDIIIFHDLYLHSELDGKEERENEWLEQIESLRVMYNDKIRIVFLCERKKTDPFLGELVNHNVLDIYRTRCINLSDMINSLTEEPQYSKVAIYRAYLMGRKPAFLREDGTSEEEQEEQEKQDEQEEEEDTNHPTTENGKIQEHQGFLKLPSLKKYLQEKPSKPQKIIEKKVVEKVVNKNIIKRDYKINIERNVKEVVGYILPKRMIVVAGLSPRVGTTFISHLLAESIAAFNIDTNYIESPFIKPYTYDILNLDQKAPNYVSPFYELAKKRSGEELEGDITTQWNEKKRVKYSVKNPKKENVYTEEEITFEDITKVLLADQALYTIVDIGNDLHREIHKDLIDISHNVLFVVDSDISLLQRFVESEEETALFNSPKTYFIGNRFTEKIKKNEIFDQYRDKFQSFLPSFDVEAVFNAQYEGKVLFHYSKPRVSIERSFQPLLKKLLPKEVMKQPRGIFKFPKISITTNK